MMPSRQLMLAFVALVLVGNACATGPSEVPVLPPDTTVVTPPGQQGTWSSAAPMLDGRSEFGVAVFRDQIYVAGGNGSGDLVSERVFRYDAGTDAWERLADLPQPRFAMPLVVVGDTMYAVGGLLQPGIRLRSLWAYIPSTDTWVDRPELPDEIIKGGAVELDGELVLAGGSNGPDPIFDLVDSMAIYSPLTQTWRRGVPLLNPRTALSVVSTGGLLYALHGITQLGGLALNDVYDPVTSEWSPRADAETPRLETAAAVLNGRIHILGGFDRAFATIVRHEVYDPQTNTWDAYPNLPTGVNTAGAVTLDGALYVMGGLTQSGNTNSSVDVFRLNP